MNTKEQFIAFLKANGIEFEVIGNQILFDFQGVNLVASNLATVKKKDFSVNIPFVWKEGENATNADKDLVRQYLNGELKDASGCSFSETVENNTDGSFSPESLMESIKKLLSKDFQEEYAKVIKTEFAMMELFFVELPKLAIDFCTELLGSLTKSKEE